MMLMGNRNTCSDLLNLVFRIAMYIVESLKSHLPPALLARMVSFLLSGSMNPADDLQQACLHACDASDLSLWP
jgi:hypothetical protein